MSQEPDLDRIAASLDEPFVDHARSARRAIQSDWPAHLRDDAPYVQCSACQRKSWAESSPGSSCLMPQPNGDLCPGTFSAEPRA